MQEMWVEKRLETRLKEWWWWLIEGVGVVGDGGGWLRGWMGVSSIALAINIGLGLWCLEVGGDDGPPAIGRRLE